MITDQCSSLGRLKGPLALLPVHNAQQRLNRAVGRPSTVMSGKPPAVHAFSPLPDVTPLKGTRPYPIARAIAVGGHSASKHGSLSPMSREAGKRPSKAANSAAIPATLRLVPRESATTLTFTRKFVDDTAVASSSKPNRQEFPAATTVGNSGRKQPKRLRRASLSEGDLLGTHGSYTVKGRPDLKKATEAPKPSRKRSQHQHQFSNVRNAPRLSASVSRYSSNNDEAIDIAQCSTSYRTSSGGGAKTAEMNGLPYPGRKLDSLQLAAAKTGSKREGLQCSMLQFITQSQREYARTGCAVLAGTETIDSLRRGKNPSSKHARVVPMSFSSESRAEKLQSISKSGSAEHGGRNGAGVLASLKLVPELVQATEWCRAKREAERLEREKLEV